MTSPGRPRKAKRAPPCAYRRSSSNPPSIPSPSIRCSRPWPASTPPPSRQNRRRHDGHLPGSTRLSHPPRLRRSLHEHLRHLPAPHVQRAHVVAQRLQDVPRLLLKDVPAPERRRLRRRVGVRLPPPLLHLVWLSAVLRRRLRLRRLRS